MSWDNVFVIFTVSVFLVFAFASIFFGEKIEKVNGRARYKKYKSFIDAKNEDEGNSMSDKRAESKVKKSHHKATSDSDIERLRQSFSDEEVEEIVELLFATDEFDQQFK